MSEKNERTAALDFAARIRSAVGRKRDVQKALEQEEKARKARVASALDRLFDDLEAMGKAADVLEIERRRRRIRIRLDDREITIQSKPSKEQDDLLEIRASGVEQELSGYLGEEIDRWALKIDHPEKEGRPAHTQVYALLGMGMTWLIEHGLDLDLEPPPEPGGDVDKDL
jgi:hypothetical protein